MRYKNEEGQAIIAVAVAMSLFLIAALGLAVDGSQMYSHRQMAQTAADATATATMLSVYDGTYSSGTTSFAASPGTSFTCTTSDARLPCRYARQNGFGGNAADTVTIAFPSSPSTTAPGVTFSTPSASTFPSALVTVSISRDVSTTLMRMVGPNVATVKATAMAGIVDVFAPVPILVNHPTTPPAKGGGPTPGSFNMNGGIALTITGGPPRSVEVNSKDANAVQVSGASGTIDLSGAGPNLNGADFGVQGGPTSVPFTFVAGTRPGKYLPNAAWIRDPLANVSPPPVPTNTGNMGTHVALANGTSGCPASPKKGCQLYYPGLYTSGIDGTLSTPVFIPGIYYIQSNQGMKCASNCEMYMATGFTDTYTGTSWTGNVLFYNTGSTSNPTATGPFDLGSNGSINLVGSPVGSTYKGILFFQDRSADAQTHSLGGGGGMTLIGTIYMTNTRATMLGSASHFQELDLQGTPGSSTQITGEIIVDALHLGGNAGITMNLSSTNTLIISQIALVN